MSDPLPLTAAQLAQSRVIAKGRRIRDVERLVADYGGRASRWTKKASPVCLDENGEYEYHWYEHQGLGRFEVKRKPVNHA